MTISIVPEASSPTLFTGNSYCATNKTQFKVSFFIILNGKQSVAVYKVKAFKGHFIVTFTENTKLIYLTLSWGLFMYANCWQKPSPCTKIVDNSLSINCFKSRYCLDSIGSVFIFVETCEGKSLLSAPSNYFKHSCKQQLCQLLKLWTGRCHQKSRFFSQDCFSLLIHLGFVSHFYRKGSSAGLIQGGNAMSV